MTWPAPLQATPVQLQVSSVASAHPWKLPVTAAQLVMPSLKPRRVAPAWRGRHIAMPRHSQTSCDGAVMELECQQLDKSCMCSAATKMHVPCTPMLRPHLRSCYAVLPLAPPSAPQVPGTRRDTAGKLTACRLAGSLDLLAGVQLHAKSATSCARLYASQCERKHVGRTLPHQEAAIASLLSLHSCCTMAATRLGRRAAQDRLWQLLCTFLAVCACLNGPLT